MQRWVIVQSTRAGLEFSWMASAAARGRPLDCAIYVLRDVLSSTVGTQCLLRAEERQG